MSDITGSIFEKYDLSGEGAFSNFLGGIFQIVCIYLLVYNF